MPLKKSELFMVLHINPTASETLKFMSLTRTSFPYETAKKKLWLILFDHFEIPAEVQFKN